MRLSYRGAELLVEQITWRFCQTDLVRKKAYEFRLFKPNP